MQGALPTTAVTWPRQHRRTPRWKWKSHVVTNQNALLMKKGVSKIPTGEPAL
jgi:hypothetical protein